MAFKRSWPMIGRLALCLACQQLVLSVASLQVNLNNDKQTSVNNQKVGQTNQLNEQATPTLDEILRDTHQLLDTLDRKLDAVEGTSNNNNNNKTQQIKRQEAEMRMLRELANQNQANTSRNLDEEHRLTSLAEEFSSERRLAADMADSLLVAPSEFEQQSTGAKRTRQLIDDAPPLGQSAAGSARFTDNQFTEKHIHFSLNLMRAVFSSHSSNQNSIDSFLISPVSIQTVLMMMHLGARGQTRRELANCLHLTPASASTLPVAATTTTAARDGNPSGSNSTTSLNKDSKLFRRHQQPLLAGANPKQVATMNQHHQQPGGAISQRVHQQTGAHLNKQMSQEAQTNTFHEQFGSAMRQLLKDPSVMKALSSANQIFLQRDLPLSAQFEWAVKNYYGTDLKQVDFQNQDDHEQQQHNRSSVASNSTSSKANNNNSNNVRLMINEWVERQTRGRISNFLMSPVPSSTLLMALNLVFFKGDWQYKFDPADTQADGLFSLANGRTVKVPMMVNKLPLAHAHDPQMKASLIELPYKAQRLSLFILLPDETNGVFDLMRQLTPSSFANLISKMRKPSGSQPTGSASSATSATGAPLAAADSSGGGINVRIPKFTIESSPRMSQLLSQQLGLKTLFAADLADLSGMFNQKKPKQVNGTDSDSGNQTPVVQVGLDELLHKAVLEVHEQGSVAAAASAIIVERVGVFNGQYFEADHPFLFFLMDKQSGLVLFSGVFAGPQQQQQQDSEQQATRKPTQQPTQTNSTATVANEHHHNHLGRSLRQANTIN